MKKLFSLILVGVMLLTGGIFLSACKDKPDPEPEGNSKTFTIERASTTAEADIISVKLIDEEKVIIIIDGQGYSGTYTKVDNKYTINVSVEDAAHVFELETGAPVTLEEVTTEAEPILDSIKLLKETSDYKFVNGLYKSVVDYYEGTYSASEEDGYFYKVSDSEMYTQDASYHTNKVSLEVVGDCLFYSVFDNSGACVRQDMFFVEKASEHEAGLNAVGTFGDLIYTCEGGEKYYYGKVDNADLKLPVTTALNYSATKIFKGLGSISGTTNVETAEISLTLNLDKTVNLTIAGNENYNISTSGKWYNISTGILVVLDNKDFFAGYFAIGAYQGGFTVDRFASSPYSGFDCRIDGTSFSYAYGIAWTSSLEQTISNS